MASDSPAIVRDGTEYFILSHHDVLYLIANSCPHRGGPLKFGFINANDEIVCPLHRGAFPIAKLVALASTIRLDEREVARR
jgi:nitrite reductase (NADH) small subunit